MIDNPRSPRVRAVAKLAKRDARAETGLFLLEGPQAVSEALQYRPDLLVELFATPTALERYSDISRRAAEEGIEVEFVSEVVLDAMADTVTPQGIIAVCRQFPTSLKDILGSEPKLIAILEEVRDPGNAGTIIRAADAAGADAVILTGRSVDLYNPKVVRATTGSLFHLPVAISPELEIVVEKSKGIGLQVIAADIKGADLLAARKAGALAAPTAWLFGNEARGLSDEHYALADWVITVPIYGHAESMNLATAASVCLYESAFAQRST
jgi:RNA methyltransferase, TrmH family